MKPATDHISIILADDHELYLDGLSTHLSANPRYRVLATCTNGEQLLSAAKLHRPDIVITDLKMPRCSGVDVIRALQQEFPEIRSLVISVTDHENAIVQALEAGANGYVLKDAPRQELFAAVEAVYLDQHYYCRQISGKLIRLIGDNFYGPAKQVSFSPAEMSIIRLMCEDKSVREMAQVLFLSERTVEKHRSAVLNKMNVKTVAGVAIYAIKHKLYLIPD